MKVGIIGAGHMGSALAKSVGQNCKVILYDKNHEKAAFAANDCGGKATKNIQELLKSCSWIILAIKPFDFDQFAATIKEEIPKDTRICSVMSGIQVAKLKEKFPHQIVYRTMPNLAVAYGTGILAIIEDDLTPDQKKECEIVFSKVGLIEWLPENKIDAFTSLAGSGPAFNFVIIESMVEAGIAMGFSASQALEIVIQMMKGSLSILEISGKHPAELKWAIASPGGTTIAGLKALENFNLRTAVIETFIAAYKRSQDLSH